MPKIPWVPPSNRSIYDPRYKPKPPRGEDRSWKIERWEDEYDIREPRPMTASEVHHRNMIMEREYERLSRMTTENFMPMMLPPNMRSMRDNIERDLMLMPQPPKVEEKGPPFDITVELFYDARRDRKVLRLKATVIGKDFEVQHQFGDYMNIDPGEIAYHRRRMEETMQEELLAYWVENHS